ncbi:MAG: hypothetical protein GEU94_04415 [Micromonosporaceae bacterium]|nr:hypothetical protein [Micromonosporaceae bacterium]
MAEVIRLDERAARRGDPSDPTARITPRAGRSPRRPVIPSPEELAEAAAFPDNGVPTLLPLQPPTPTDEAGRADGPRTSGAGSVRRISAAAEPDEWDQRVASRLAFLRRRLTGEYDVDEFGFDPDLTDHVLIPMLRLLYQHWFRVEVSGVENIPADGSALLVANHSGTIALDALMLMVAVRDEHPKQRRVRSLGADLVFRLPLVNEFARKSGATLACTQDVERLLNTGELVAVFPEGFKGVGKPFSERYKLQRFGRGGFVSAAMRTGAPIVPVSIVGAEETYPLVGDIKPLARLLGAPYFPVTPLFPWLGPLGLIPLPSKWLIHFGEPIDTTPLGDGADDPMVVFNLGDQVREAIQQTLYNVLLRRTSIFG